MFKNEKVREVIAWAARNPWDNVAKLAVVVVLPLLVALFVGTYHYVFTGLGYTVSFVFWAVLAMVIWIALLLLAAFVLLWVKGRYICYNNTEKLAAYIEVRRSDDLILSDTRVAPSGFYWRGDPQASLYTVFLPDNKERVTTDTVTQRIDLGVEGAPLPASMDCFLVARLSGKFCTADLLQISRAGYNGVDAWFVGEFHRALEGTGSVLAKAAAESLRTGNHDMLAIAVRELVQKHGPPQTGQLPSNVQGLVATTWLGLLGSTAWLTK